MIILNNVNNRKNPEFILFHTEHCYKYLQTRFKEICKYL